MTNKGIVIFSGFNQRAVIAFLRSLTAQKISFGIIALSDKDEIFNSIYKKNVVYTRKSVPLQMGDLFEGLRIAKKKLGVEELIIMPSTEALVRFILEHRDRFSKENMNIPLVNKALYHQISDKFSFSRLCLEHGIKIPKEYKSIEETKFPFVAKPKTYFSKVSNHILAPIIIYNQKQKEAFIADYNDVDFYYQEFVEGKSRYLLYYFHSDKTVYKFSQENLVQQPGGKSIVAARSTDFHLSDESKKYENLFLKIGFTGFVMIEVIGENYMIESNPRLWGPSQLFVDAKAPLFEAFLHDHGFISTKPSPETNVQKEVLYFWNGGIKATQEAELELDYHNYDAQQLEENYPRFMEVDVLNRGDFFE